MRRSSDATRAFIIVIIILTVLQIQAQNWKQCAKPTPPQCVDDCNGTKWFRLTTEKGTSTCQQCPPCNTGFELDSDCGGDQGSRARCVPLCQSGKFYDSVKQMCTHCRLCENTIGDRMCSAANDTVCGLCMKGFYHENDTPDLCHPCSFLSQPELEPQCQTLESTVDPSTAYFTSLERTTVMPHDGDQTTPKDDDKEVLVTPAYRTDVPPLQEVIPGDIKVVPDETFENEGSVDSVDEKEADEQSFASSSTTHITLVIVALILLLLIGFGIAFVYAKKRSQRSEQMRQHQRLSYVEYLQSQFDNGNDEDAETSTVAFDVPTCTALYTMPATRDQNFATTAQSYGELSSGLEASGHNFFRSQFLPRNCSFESADGSSAKLVGNKGSYHRMSYLQNQTYFKTPASVSRDGTSTSLGDFYLYDEGDLFFNKPLDITEHPVPSTQDVGEGNHSDSTHLPEKGKCASRVNGANNVPDNDPVPQALQVKPDGETEAVFDARQSAESVREKMECCQEEAQPGEIPKSFVNLGVQFPSTGGLYMKDDDASSSSGCIEKKGEGTAKPIEPEATLCIARDTQTEPQLDAAAAAAAAEKVQEECSPAKNRQQVVDDTKRAAVTAVPLDITRPTQTEPPKGVSTHAHTASHNISAAPSTNRDTCHNNSVKDSTCCKGPNINITGNRNKVYVLQNSQVNGSFSYSDTDTESEE